LSESKRRPSLVAFIIIGLGMVTVGISTETWGLMGAGMLFIIIGAVSVVQSRREQNAADDGGSKHEDRGQDRQ
jgi:hypothetical protein